ncbi:MAG: protein kinase, partial [Acidobacteria bacterium]|nr:protein kinase [Acidobacteriota bacterium]
MGVVWRALDTKTGSAVAVKLMKDISDPLAVELFTKEWRTLAELSHPNIVDVRDVDVVEENRQKRPFFVMPLLRGATLGELIANASPRLSCARIVEIMIQVCRGLQAAHQRGLVHRDMKPSNIFVMEDDTAKVIDFGVVHLAGSKSVTGQKGTFQYMSPEQAQMKELTSASDLFSLGVILYEALTLRKPFQRATAEDTIQAIVKYMPPSVSEINPSINQSMSMVVHKCLAKQPIHRFSSARELSEALQKALRNEPVFDPVKIEPRIDRAKAAFKRGDEAFASEILAELEAEGHVDPRITVLRTQIDTAVKQKKLRQLLEAARARMEQDEIPLALDKLREVLELDPQNSEAVAMREAMERQRSEAQVAKWFELAERHLENRDFASARHAAQQVLSIRRGDPRALDLLEKIESTEAEAVRIREQKEQLYSSALVAYQNGEIETALGKLERLFSVARANPNAAVPERDAVYQSFYKEIRSERDTIHAALEDAHRHFSDKKFAEAMVVCRELLTKYPNDGTFQALKIRIEDAERQELSSYIAEVSKRVESEPDLDRRANILREASERYPGEGQFAQQLKLVRERRDLVNSIVAKARQYDERRQYAEAISQWDILRNIYPQYPGIAIELEQSKKKRDRQVREEEQARLVEEIDRLIQNRAYAKAVESANAALVDFPGEPEISGLRTLAEEGLERMQQSRRLFEEAQRALAEPDLERAAELLRKSLNLDPRSVGVKDVLVDVLTQRARGMADANWQGAEPLYEEANQLEPDHPAVRALRSSITEAKRQTFVGQCLAECRALVGAGNLRGAAERVRGARVEYPNDVRLEQYEAGL